MRYLTIFIALLIFGCKPEQPKPANLSATIENMEAKEISFTGFGIDKMIPVQDGKINADLNIPKSGLYNFRFGRNNLDLYMTPGDQITFTADAADFGTSVKIESPHKKIQNFLKAKKSITSESFGRNLFKSTEALFLETIKTTGKKILDELNKIEGPADFIADEKKNIEYEAAQLTYIFPKYANKKLEDLPKAFQNPLKEIDLRDENIYLKSSEYRDLVSSVFTMSMNQDTVQEYEETFMKHISAVPIGNIKNQLLYGDMRYLMGPNEKMEMLNDFFKKHSTNKKHLAEMAKKYSELQVLAKGNPSPKFDYENFKGGNTKLDDLTGKYVYIDVWATWCGPCKREIPSLKKVEHQYAGKNIEFVSISVDTKEAYDKWRDMVKDKELGGTQLISDKDWKSQFVQDYQINGIPRFILVDPEGNIVSADAPRPSDKKLVEQLNDLSI